MHLWSVNVCRKCESTSTKRLQRGNLGFTVVAHRQINFDGKGSVFLEQFGLEMVFCSSSSKNAYTFTQRSITDYISIRNIFHHNARGLTRMSIHFLYHLIITEPSLGRFYPSLERVSKPGEFLLLRGPSDNVNKIQRCCMCATN